MALLRLFALLLVAAAMVAVHAQESVSLVELGSASSINAAAARPLQDVAQLLCDARNTLNQLDKSRQEFQVIRSHTTVRSNVHLPDNSAANTAAAQQGTAGPDHVNAQLIPSMAQPLIHDAERFGTHHPMLPTQDWVDADLLGEDGKPYAARPSFNTDESPKFKSPFARYVHQSEAVGSSADIALKDNNTKLTDVELKAVNSMQLRLKELLRKLGSNIVWDHTKVANRRLTREFDALKVEARQMMEEYELRTGVKTIAWQLFGADPQGLSAPTGRVKDIFFSKHPELAGRMLQRPGQPRGPPALTDAQRQISLAHYHPELAKPQEQRVSVQWKKQANGVVKAKVNLHVVNSPTLPKDLKTNFRARKSVLGRVLPNGVKLPDSHPVQIDVVAPPKEKFQRYKEMASAPALNASV